MGRHSGNVAHSGPDDWAVRCGLNSRLIATVQERAGAAVHEAAGLVHGYCLWVKALDQAKQNGDLVAAEGATREIQACVVELRRFLTRNRGQGPARAVWCGAVAVA